MENLIKIVITIILIGVFAELYIKGKREEKGKSQIILGILFVPVPFILIDMWDIFSKFVPSIYESFTEKYDMLSFLGAYIVAIVSSILLIVITNKDREENTETLRISQRPYLDVKLGNIDFKSLKKFEENNELSVLYCIKDQIEVEDLDRAECIRITNKGASTAIIDIESVVIKYSYMKNKEGVCVKERKEINLKKYIDRITISKDEVFYIVLLDGNSYENKKIRSQSYIEFSHIEYKDLFNKRYVDEVENNMEKQKTIRDNELIIEEVEMK